MSKARTKSNSAFCKLLRQMREAKGWSQKRLAKELSVGACPVWQWENGKVVPNEDNFLKIISVFGRDKKLIEFYYQITNNRRGSNRGAFKNESGESFGSRLRELMTERELSVNRLASYLRTNANIVRKWLRDQGLPGASNFNKLFEWVGEDLTLVDLYISTQKFQHSWSMLRNNQKWVEKTVLPRSAFCERLKMERLKKNLTQADVGHELGISHSAVSLWEAKGIIPDRPKFMRLVALLELPQEMIDEYERLKSKRFRRKI